MTESARTQLVSSKHKRGPDLDIAYTDPLVLIQNNSKHELLGYMVIFNPGDKKDDQVILHAENGKALDHILKGWLLGLKETK